MVNLVFLVLLLVITIVYNTCVIVKTGVPESISATAYFFKEFNGKYWLFSIYCLICSAILLPIWITASVEAYQFLVFLSCGGILFAGATPLFREDLQKQVHYVGGIIAVVAYIIWLIVSSYWLILAIEFGLILLCVIFDRKNYVYYTEIIGLLGLITLLLILG